MNKKISCTILCFSILSSVLTAQTITREQMATSKAQATGYASPEDAIITSKSQINWTKNTFASDIELDVTKSNIPMPSGKASCINKIEMESPVLIKDPLLSIFIDDSNTLSDLVLNGIITLEDLTKIIDNSTETPPVFKENGNKLVTRHTLNILEIGNSLVKHRNPYTLRQPIKTISSRKYTGIIIDCRGNYPVQGEFVDSKIYPCLFPKIWNESMELIYERNMVLPEIVKTKGIVYYSSSQNFEDYNDRVGNDPLWISAKKVFGINRVDPVISDTDYLKITSVKENLDLIRNGKIVILLDEDQLVYDVAVPDKNKNYYLFYDNMKRFLQEKRLEETLIVEAGPGISITMQNLQFQADTDALLPSENERIKAIAQAIIEFTKNDEYKIVVEGHTADVNKPEGQMNLSVQRAQKIVELLVKEGVDESIITYRGYGGLKPVAPNDSAEGRSLNRRVEIMIIPKTTYIMRK